MMAQTPTHPPTAAAMWRERIGQAWAGLAVRERAGVGIAVVAVLGLLVWLVGIQPAWRSIQAAPKQHAALDAQLDAMRGFAAQVQALQAAPKVGLADAVKALEQVSASLGPGAELRLQGDRATLRVRAVSGEAIARWLPRAREQARAVPIEVKLTRAAKPSAIALAPVAPAAATAASTPAKLAPNAAKAISSPAEQALGANDWAWDGSIVLAITAQ